MPEGLTSSQMECIAPRDTDLIVMNNGDIESILAQLADLIKSVIAFEWDSRVLLSGRLIGVDSGHYVHRIM
jgi:hypothetical protein